MLRLDWRLGDWRKAAEARDLLEPGTRLLARNIGEDFSFAAADLSRDGVTVRRSIVRLRDGQSVFALFFDIASEPFSWHFSDAAVHTVRAPRPGVDATAALACTGPAGGIDGVDLLGASVGAWVVLFHTGLYAAQSSLSFDAKAGARFLITGLGPGHWDIWRDGWLEEMGLPVRPPTGSLKFDSGPGSFFVRKF